MSIWGGWFSAWTPHFLSMRSFAKAKAPFQQAWAVDSGGVVEGGADPCPLDADDASLIEGVEIEEPIVVGFRIEICAAHYQKPVRAGIEKASEVVCKDLLNRSVSDEGVPDVPRLGVGGIGGDVHVQPELSTGVAHTHARPKAAFLIAILSQALQGIPRISSRGCHNIRIAGRVLPVVPGMFISTVPLASQDK